MENKLDFRVVNALDHNLKKQIAFLCTDTDSFLVSFYQKYGFELLKKTYTYRGKSGKRYTEKDGMLANISSLEIFNHVMESEEILDLGTGNW